MDRDDDATENETLCELQDQIRDLFVKILSLVKVVVACRVTPQQKADLVVFAKALDLDCLEIDERTNSMKFYQAKMNLNAAVS